MKFREWLNQEARAEAKVIPLEEGLFWGMAERVLRRRFSLFTLRRIFLVALLLVEVHYLRFSFPPHLLGTLLLMKLSAAWLLSAVWGWLDPTRDRQREAWRKRNIFSFERILKDSLAWAWMAGVLIVLGSTLWLLYRTSENQWIFNFLYCYFAVIPIRFALDFIARTLYSSIYSVQRLYRPLWLYPLSETFSIIYTISLWHVYGPWTLVISQLFLAIANFAAVFWYSHQAAVKMGVSISLRPREVLKRAWKSRQMPSTANWGMAFAFFAMQSEHWLVFLFFKSPGLVQNLYILTPLLSGAMAWAQMFQFDLNHFQKTSRLAFYQRLNEDLVRWSWIVPVTLSLILFLTCHFFAKANGIVIITGLSLVVFGRSHISFRQMTDFVSKQYARVILLSAIFIAGSSCFRFIPIAPAFALAFSGLLMCILAWTGDLVFRRPHFLLQETHLPRTHWFSWINRQTQEMQLISIKLLRIPSSHRSLKVFSDQITQGLGADAKITRMSRDRMLIAYPKGRYALSEESIWKSGKGLFADLQFVSAENGKLALQTLRESDGIGSFLGRSRLQATEKNSRNELISAALNETPQAKLLSFGSKGLAKWAKHELDREQRALLFSDALRQLDEQPGLGRSPYKRKWSLAIVSEMKEEYPQFLFMPLANLDPTQKEKLEQGLQKIQFLRLLESAELGDGPKIRVSS